MTPASGSVLLGTTLQLTAKVSGTSNVGVIWNVNGTGGGNSTVGTISADGIYTAPSDLPSPASVKITAASVADPTSTASAQLTVTSDIVVGISPGTSSVELGAKQSFAATLTSAGLPDTSIHWILGGASCPNACGTVDSSGNYTAPQILPASASVTLTAQSAADPGKQGSVSITITSRFTLQLAAPGTVTTSATAVIVATLTPVSGSNPSTIINWSLAGTGCSGSACGTLSSVTTQTVDSSSSGGSDAESADYIAPANAPSPNTVTITATPLADPSKKAQATIAVQPGVGVSISPLTATVSANHRVTLFVQVSGTSNGDEGSAVIWSVGGIAGGNTSLGQICAANSNPCSMVTGSSNAAQVDYLAPGSLPSPNPLTVKAVSVADAVKNATAQITIINHDLVSVLPGNVTLAPGAIQVFAANVLGTTNQSVVWQLHGAGCNSAGACGAISSDGTYAAPGTPPVPNTLQVVAISSDDTTQSGAANVTISTGANIQSLHPASVYAGGADGFTLRVDGGGFSATTPGPGSTMLIAGNSRTTNCTSSAECTAPVFASDVAIAGNLSVQVQNPDGSRSNTVLLVVAAPNASDDSLSLTSAAPSATGKDIVVVEPSTAGVSVPGDNVDLDIAALGNFSTGTNTCTLAGNPVVLTRPATGAATFDICVFSQAGLDSSMTYSVGGPADVSVVAKQPAGLGIIHITLQVQASANPSARTLFIHNLNLDKTAASGVLEVQ
ncbi:MAG TPA: hypothetical protein VGF20_11605 [Candidatus Acidoferrum sp.]